jgi:AcrR family transcriptional regulator
VNGTGIDTITAAGVAKMSLYNNFASKDDLVLAYLEARHEEWLGLYRRRLADATDARQRVAAVFDAYIDHAELDSLPTERVTDLAEQLSFLLEGAMARAGLDVLTGDVGRGRVTTGSR